MSSIDVIVPCYRYGHYLRDCVHSVLSQPVAGLRVLIIDDASPDNTPIVGEALAREDSRVTYRRHAINRGHIATYNEGIDWAAADCTLLLSADDYLLPGALERIAGVMDAHPEVGLCFGEALELEEGGGIRHIGIDVDTAGAPATVLGGPEFVRLCVRAGSINPVPTPTAVVRTRLLKQHGGYRPDLPHSGDLEMWLRLAAHAPVGILKTELAVYRRHASNMSLAYYQEHRLADLQQRKAAFDAFLQTCGQALPEAASLYRSLLKPLAAEAVAAASTAFNSGRTELSRRLCEFAVSVHPGVRRSPSWRLLACKKLIGLRASCALLPTVARIRVAMARIRG